jgi:hypothetical protein
MIERPPVKRENELDVRELPGDEVFVYDQQERVTHHLSQELAFVWAKCDGSNGRADLERIIQSELNITEARVTVQKAITKLSQLNLLL